MGKVLNFHRTTVDHDYLTTIYFSNRMFIQVTIGTVDQNLRNDPQSQSILSGASTTDPSTYFAATSREKPVSLGVPGCPRLKKHRHWDLYGHAAGKPMPSILHPNLHQLLHLSNSSSSCGSENSARRGFTGFLRT